MMNKIIDLDKTYDLINKSNFITIAYKSMYERKVDLIIQTLNPIKIDSTNELKLVFRNEKLDSILNDKKLSNFIHIDTSNIIVPKNVSKYTFFNELFDKLKEFNKFDYKIIITSLIYSSLKSKEGIPSIIGGSSAIYMADLMLSVDEQINILKYRYESYF